MAAGQSSGSEHGAMSSRSAGASVRGEVLDVFGEAQVDDARRLRRRAMSADDIAGMPPQQQTAAPRLAPTTHPTRNPSHPLTRRPPPPPPARRPQPPPPRSPQPQPPAATPGPHTRRSCRGGAEPLGGAAANAGAHRGQFQQEARQPPPQQWRPQQWRPQRSRGGRLRRGPVRRWRLLLRRRIRRGGARGGGGRRSSRRRDSLRPVDPPHVRRARPASPPQPSHTP